MPENFIVSITNNEFEVTQPAHFHHATTETVSTTYRNETPKIEHGTVEIALTAVGGVLGTLAVVGVIYLNHQHDRKVKQRQRIDDTRSRNPEHSLQ